MQWSVQIAQGLAYIHSRVVLQSDIGCHNIMLDQQGNLKFSDFAGSSIDGAVSDVCSDVHYSSYSSSREVTIIQTKIFGLEPTLCEIWTWTKPYQDKPNEEVQLWNHEQQFPELDGILIAEAISTCWTRRYSAAKQVANDLLRLQTRLADSVKDNVEDSARPQSRSITTVLIVSSACCWQASTLSASLENDNALMKNSSA
jgi:serine/threonine protein kinase